MSELFLLAVRAQKYELVAKILKAGVVDVNFQDEVTGRAAIHEAALNLDCEMIALLASYQAELDLRDALGFSAFNHVVDAYDEGEVGFFPVIDLLRSLDSDHRTNMKP